MNRITAGARPARARARLTISSPRRACAGGEVQVADHRVERRVGVGELQRRPSALGAGLDVPAEAGEVGAEQGEDRRGRRRGRAAGASRQATAGARPVEVARGEELRARRGAGEAGSPGRGRCRPPRPPPARWRVSTPSATARASRRRTMRASESRITWRYGSLPGAAHEVAVELVDVRAARRGSSCSSTGRARRRRARSRLRRRAASASAARKLGTSSGGECSTISTIRRCGSIRGRRARARGGTRGSRCRGRGSRRGRSARAGARPGRWAASRERRRDAGAVDGGLGPLAPDVLEQDGRPLGVRRPWAPDQALERRGAAARSMPDLEDGLEHDRQSAGLQDRSRSVGSVGTVCASAPDVPRRPSRAVAGAARGRIALNRMRLSAVGRARGRRRARPGPGRRASRFGTRRGRPA